MELIEKIEALYDEHQDKHDYSGEYRGGWDDCIERVLDIIKSELEPKDEPDSEGWWWYDDSNVFSAFMFVQKLSNGKFACYLTEGVTYCDKLSGKWIKAIVPESEW